MTNHADTLGATIVHLETGRDVYVFEEKQFADLVAELREKDLQIEKLDAANQELEANLKVQVSRLRVAHV